MALVVEHHPVAPVTLSVTFTGIDGEVTTARFAHSAGRELLLNSPSLVGSNTLVEELLEVVRIRNFSDFSLGVLADLLVGIIQHEELSVDELD